MIKGIVFDCFGVLYGGSLLTLLGMCPAERRQELIDLNTRNDYGYLTSDEYAEGVAEIIGTTPDEARSIFKQKRVRDQPMFDYIYRLRERGLKTAMLTNAGMDMPRALFSEDELNGGLFDVYLVSSQMGLIKPDLEAFKMIADKLGLSPDECLMIDDTESNIRGADAAGMPGVWFTDAATAMTHIEEHLARSA